MKKIVLTFGLISGAIMSALMLVNVSYVSRYGFERGEIVGYSTMVASLLLIYFGVRSYRDNVAGGSISFGRALKVGALIALVASVCYVAMWQVAHDRIAPDFVEKYQAHVLETARADGETETQLAERKAEMDKFARWYRNPVLKAAFTFLEPFPVALIMTLVTAGVVSRRRNMAAPGTARGSRVVA